MANQMIENCVGCLGLPFGLGLNFKINGRHGLVVPMVVEEPSVVAAVSGAAKLVASAGGFTATSSPRNIIYSQIQLLDIEDSRIQHVIDLREYFNDFAFDAKPFIDMVESDFDTEGIAQATNLLMLFYGITSQSLSSEIIFINKMQSILGDLYNRFTTKPEFADLRGRFGRPLVMEPEQDEEEEEEEERVLHSPETSDFESCASSEDLRRIAAEEHHHNFSRASTFNANTTSHIGDEALPLKRVKLQRILKRNRVLREQSLSMVDLVDNLKAEQLTSTSIMEVRLEESLGMIAQLKQRLDEESQSRVVTEEKYTSLKSRLQAFKDRIKSELCPKTERDEALANLAESEAALQDLNEIHQQVQGELAESQEELTQSQSEVQLKSDLVAHTQKELAHSQAEVKKRTTAYQTILEKCKSLSAQLTALDSSHKQTTEFKDKIKVRYSEMEKTLQSLNGQKEIIQKAFQEQKIEYQNELEGNVKQRRELEVHNHQLTLNIASLQKQLQTEQSEKEIYKTELVQIRAGQEIKVDSFNSAIEKVSAQKDLQISKLKADNEYLTSSVSKLKLTLDSRSHELQTIQKDLSGKQDMLDRLNQDLHGTSDKASSLISNLGVSKQKQLDLAGASLNQMLEVSHRLEKLQNQESRFHVSTKELRRNILALKDRIAEVKENRDDWKEKAKGFEEELDAAQSREMELKEYNQKLETALGLSRKNSLLIVKELRDTKKMTHETLENFKNSSVNRFSEIKEAAILERRKSTLILNQKEQDWQEKEQNWQEKEQDWQEREEELAKRYEIMEEELREEFQVKEKTLKDELIKAKAELKKTFDTSDYNSLLLKYQNQKGKFSNLATKLNYMMNEYEKTMSFGKENEILKRKLHNLEENEKVDKIVLKKEFEGKAKYITFLGELCAILGMPAGSSILWNDQGILTAIRKRLESLKGVPPAAIPLPGEEYTAKLLSKSLAELAIFKRQSLARYKSSFTGGENANETLTSLPTDSTPSPTSEPLSIALYTLSSLAGEHASKNNQITDTIRNIVEVSREMEGRLAYLKLQVQEGEVKEMKGKEVIDGFTKFLGKIEDIIFNVEVISPKEEEPSVEIRMRKIQERLLYVTAQEDALLSRIFQRDQFIRERVEQTGELERWLSGVF